MNKYEDEIFDESLEIPETNEKSSHFFRIKRSPLPQTLWLRVAVITFIVAALIGLGFYITRFVMSNDTRQSSTSQQSEQDAISALEEQSKNASTFNETSASNETITKRTNAPRLEVTFPRTWSLTEEAGGVTLASPPFQFTNVRGDTIDNGFFKIYIRQGARSVDAPYFGTGIASVQSTPLTYQNPALGQRETTNISFFGDNATDNTAYLLVAGNYSLNQGETLGSDFASNPETYIVVGGYSSKELSDDLEMHPVDSSFFSSTETYQQGLDIIRSLKLL